MATLPSHKLMVIIKENCEYSSIALQILAICLKVCINLAILCKSAVTRRHLEYLESIMLEVALCKLNFFIRFTKPATSFFTIPPLFTPMQSCNTDA